MRPNQQNNNNKNRSRGRNGGRKHVNPLSRNFESNGPDVKVRGNAAHIAEKYLQLARDAQSSGDSVMAENYLQHAEHYFRIVTAAQQQSGQRPDQYGQDNDDFDDDMPEVNSRFSSPQPQQPVQAEAEEQPEPAESPAVAASEDAPAQAAQPEGEQRKPRERRPRRRRPAGGDAGNGDPANAPQPEMGELPAFITAGGTSTAAE
jgi:hypothetical protein